MNAKAQGPDSDVSKGEMTLSAHEGYQRARDGLLRGFKTRYRIDKRERNEEKTKITPTNAADGSGGTITVAELETSAQFVAGCHSPFAVSSIG